MDSSVPSIEVIKIAASAGLGLFVGVLLQWWKSARDERRAACDELCRAVRGLTDTAAEYWLEDNTKKQNALEAKLIGLQTEVNGLVRIFRDQMSFEHRRTLDNAMKDLIRVATGDNFGDRTSSSEIPNARGTYTAGGHMISSARSALAHRNSVLGGLSSRMGW